MMVAALRGRPGVAARVGLAVSTIPAFAAAYGFGFVPAVVGDTPADAAVVREAVLHVIAAAAACSIVAVWFVRRSLRSAVDRIERATSAIALGDFQHRIGRDHDDELGRLSRAIDAMAARLEQLEQARRRMLACVSHELRTPLTIIRGRAFTLARGEADPMRRARLDEVQEEAVRLTQLIEDLVDASSLHAGGMRLEVEQCDLATIADGAVGRFVDVAREHGLSLELVGDRRGVGIDADPARIEQVLANLLANAVRHATAGTTILVAIDRSGDRNCWSITVTNRGAPIPDALARRVFEPFVQGANNGGRIGLGLAIAHGIAAAHGGLLELVQDDPGQVAFRLSLPSSSTGLERVAMQRRPIRLLRPALRTIEP